MRPYSPGGALIAFASARRGLSPPTPSAQRLRPGLPGYLIPFAPLAFVHQGQLQARKPPSPLVFLPISTHFTANREFHFPLLNSSDAVSSAISGLSPNLSHPTYSTPYGPFTPSKSEQRLPPPCYRGCWHGVSRGFLPGFAQHPYLFNIDALFPGDRSLQPEGLHPPRGVASSRFRALRMILDCSLP